MTTLLDHLQARRDGGAKLLVPYLMAGVPEPAAFSDALSRLSGSADAIEVGLPFSDPLMDGPVIASAGERALRNGIGPRAAMELVKEVPQSGTPRILMTYYNPIHRVGELEFCRRAAASGISGLIVPDLPLEESAHLRNAAAADGLAWIPLVAPTSSQKRIEALAATCTGFLYAVSALGVTGVRASLSERAAAVTAACRAITDLPVLVGIGVSTAAHAVEATRTADGVVIGSAIVRAVVDEGVAAAVSFLDGVRRALDEAGGGATGAGGPAGS
ncbi:MAG: tryptophan synthase subunit alpha [Actinomycetota bacterium]|nr:tryptophan synthase subunit alpha [Actinomycetota bacterium]